MTKADHYAVFGCPIKHSKSPLIHSLFAEQTQQCLIYEAFQVNAVNFNRDVKLFFSNGGKGLNCTVPLKELAWQFSDETSHRAKRAKAVNTLVLQQDGSVFGDNTDGVGLITDLVSNCDAKLKGAAILVLGAGGATRGILEPLIKRQPSSIVIANRTVSKAVLLAEEFAEYNHVTASSFSELHGLSFDLIINATSASLSDDLPPIPDGILIPSGICYDLAYANKPTAFVRWGLRQNARTSVDGLGMLVEQAAEAFLLWRGIRPITDTVINQFNAQRG